MRSGPSSLLLAPVERSIQFSLNFPSNVSGRLDGILVRIIGPEDNKKPVVAWVAAASWICGIVL